MSALPEPPENVCIEYADGSRLPLSCVYSHQDGGGTHHWVALIPGAVEHVEGMQITIASLPAKTSVDVKMTGRWKERET